MAKRMSDVERWCKELGQEILAGDYDDGIAYIAGASAQRMKQLAPSLMGQADATATPTQAPAPLAAAYIAPGMIVRLNPLSNYRGPWKYCTFKVIDRRRTRCLVEVVDPSASNTFGRSNAAQRVGVRRLAPMSQLVEVTDAPQSAAKKEAPQPATARKGKPKAALVARHGPTMKRTVRR